MFQFSISIILPGYQSGSLPIRTFEIPQTLALALSVVKIFFGVWLAVKGLSLVKVCREYCCYVQMSLGLYKHKCRRKPLICVEQVSSNGFIINSCSSSSFTSSLLVSNVLSSSCMTIVLSSPLSSICKLQPIINMCLWIYCFGFFSLLCSFLSGKVGCCWSSFICWYWLLFAYGW